MTYALSQFNPNAFSYAKQLIFRTFPFLSKIKLNVRQFAMTLLIALLFNQEFQLQRRFIVDFRPLTGGFWSEVDNILVHYLRSASTSVTALNLHLFHGFGANGLSWQPVMKLFKRNSVNAVAHDISGFGFNPRIRKIPDESYSPIIYRPLWNAKASLSFSGASTSLKEKNGVILMGHSLGSVSSMAAAAAVLSDDIKARESGRPKRDVTLVLVDPAFSFSPDQLRKSLNKSAVLNEPTTISTVRVNALETSLSNIEKVATGVRSSQPLSPTPNRNMLQVCCEFVIKIVKSVLMWPVKIFLRRLVHLDYFWLKALPVTWGNINKIKEEDVYRYKLASMAKGFDDDFIRFVLAQKPSSSGGEGSSFSSSSIVTGVTQVDLLAGLVDLGCRVVIVHGTADHVVPYSSSERMAALVQEELSPNGAERVGSAIELVPLEEFGHVPQEEDPALFLEKLSKIGIRLDRS